MNLRGITFGQVRGSLANTVMDWPDRDDPSARIHVGEVEGLRIKVVWRPSHRFVITVADFDK